MRYNHSHDQLVLTGSSDSRLILSNMVSISSEPFGHLVDDDDLSDNEETQQDEKYKSLSDIFRSCFVCQYLMIYYLVQYNIYCNF